eukprot:2350067-Prymnesium_polylepis.1
MTASTTRRVSAASSLSPTTDLRLERLLCAALALPHAALARISRAAAPGGGATIVGGIIFMIPWARPTGCASVQNEATWPLPSHLLGYQVLPSHPDLLRGREWLKDRADHG